MKNKFVEITQKILLDSFYGVYCYNCKFMTMSEEEAEEKFGYYGCEDCHRKYMCWELSEESAKSIAENIWENIKNELLKGVTR